MESLFFLLIAIAYWRAHCLCKSLALLLIQRKELYLFAKHSKSAVCMRPVLVRLLSFHGLRIVIVLSYVFAGWVTKWLLFRTYNPTHGALKEGQLVLAVASLVLCWASFETISRLRSPAYNHIIRGERHRQDRHHHRVHHRLDSCKL